MTDTTQTPQGNSGGGTLSGNVLFYNNPEPLSLEAHGKLGVKQLDTPFAFLAKAHAVPITVGEFGSAGAHYPIVFAGQDYTPIAVMGIKQEENLFVSADGKFQGDYYMPAFARRYPFVFANDNNSDRLIVCVDTAAPMVGKDHDIAFFEEDKPSKFTSDAIEFCKEFERQRLATAEFTKRIKEADLFEEKSISFTPRNPDGSEGSPQKIADYTAISEEKLRNLSAEQFIKLRDDNLLPAIYACHLSLQNWQRIIQRALAAANTTQVN